MSDRGRAHRVGTVLVATQFALVGLVLAPVGPVVGSGQLRPLGLALLALAAIVGGLALVELGRDTRVHPIPVRGTVLHTHGVYAFIRHPMYAAVLLACSGVTVSTGRVLALVALLLLVGVLAAKARLEDQFLEAMFGGQFAAYASRVPAILPQPWRSHAR
jgi:protein-S-isoprenylcysteine O-methyltransferase Ste14